MKYPKLRELKEAVIALVTGPYTTRFPYQPHTPEVRFRGKPVPNDKECIGCGACAEVCPAVAIEVVNDTTALTRRVIWRYDLCIFCGQCERLCTTKQGVKLSNTEFDLATLDRKTLTAEVKKKLVLCDKCNELIGTQEQILWIATKLGTMSFGNMATYTATHESLGLNDEINPPELDPVRRANLFTLTCPKCRRVNLLIDEYGINYKK